MTVGNMPTKWHAEWLPSSGAAAMDGADDEATDEGECLKERAFDPVFGKSDEVNAALTRDPGGHLSARVSAGLAAVTVTDLNRS